MSEDGTDDPTLCNRHEPEKQGLRYCRGCDDFIALDLFPKSKNMGFACKKHVSAHGGGRKAKLKMMADVNKKRQILAWKQCYNDRKLFKQARVDIRQQEIEDEVMKVDANPIQGCYAAVPMDCTAIINSQNIAVVNREERKILIKFFQENNIAKYHETVRQIVKRQKKST